MLMIERLDVEPSPKFLYDEFLNDGSCPVNVWVNEGLVARLYGKSNLSQEQIEQEAVYLGWDCRDKSRLMLGEYDADSETAYTYLGIHFGIYKDSLSQLRDYMKGEDLRNKGSIWDN